MRRKNIIVWGSFPPPYTGQSIGTDVVYNILKEKDDFNVIKVNVSPTKFLVKNPLIHLYFYLKGIRKLIRLVFSKKISVDYFYFVPAVRKLSHFKDVLLMALFRKVFDKVICHIRSGEFDKVQRYFTFRFFQNSVDTFIFLSQGLANKCNKIRDSKSVVIYNFIDPTIEISDFEFHELLEKKFFNLQTYHIAYISNLIPSKGYKILLHCFLKLHKKRKDIVLHIVGDGDSDNVEFLKNFIYDNNLQQHVCYHGRVADRQVLKKIYEQMHLFVLPTCYPTEAQPRSIIEAFNFGIPVISTAHASIPEIIKESYDGIIISIEDDMIKKLEISIEFLINNDLIYFSKNARKSYVQRHKLDVVKTKFYEVFAE